MSASKSYRHDTATVMPVVNDSDVPDDGGIPWAKWPDASLPVRTDMFFSVACGNSHYHWALHVGVGFQFVPQFFWKTCVLKDDDIRKSKDPCLELQVHLPDCASEIIFGPPRWLEDCETSIQFATQLHAVEASVGRRLPVVSVYVISTNAEHERGLKYLFSKVPCRLFKLKASDFWNVSSYPTIGVDRVAALRGAQSCNGLPALVIDGGTAMTFTAADADGELMGGDISPGLAWRIKALHRSVAKVGGKPLLQLRSVATVIKNGAPLKCFSKDPKQCVLNCALMDIGYKCYHVVKTWLKEVGPAIAASGDANKEDKEEKDGGTAERKCEKNLKRVVTITGGDMELITELLKTVEGQFHSKIIAPEPGAERPKAGEFVVEQFRGAIHYGVAQVLVDQLSKQVSQKQGNENPESDKLRIQILGLRVAMLESELDEARRGSIVSVSQGRTIDDDWFLVHLDDGEARNYNLFQIYDGLKKYLEYGEVASLEGGLTTAQRCARDLKKKEVQKSAEMLAMATEEMKAHAEVTSRPKANPKSKAKAANAVPAGAKKRGASIDGTKKASTATTAGNTNLTNSGKDAKKNSTAAADATKKHVAAEQITSPTETVLAETASDKPTTAKKPKRSATAEATTPTNTPVAKKSKTTAKATPASAKNGGKSESAKKDDKSGSKRGASLVGQRVAKYFKKTVFFGTVTEYSPKVDDDDQDLWKIHYDDNDVEEYDSADMEEALLLYSENVADDPN